MLALAIGVPPLVALGLVALWTRSRGHSKLEIVNLIAVAPKSKRSKRTRSVDAVVLHQMSFSRGDDPKRYQRVTAHFIVTPNGTVAQLHPLAAKLPASNGFNGRSVAIEFAGNLRASNGNWWKPEKFGRDFLTAQQVEAGRNLLRMLAQLGIKNVFAHRQSSHDRGNCPGPEVWSSVGQWGLEELGFHDGGPGYAIGTGRPIPEAWRSARSS